MGFGDAEEVNQMFLWHTSPTQSDPRAAPPLRVAVLGIFVMVAGGSGWLPSAPALVVVLAGAIGTLLGSIWGMRVEHHW